MIPDAPLTTAFRIAALMTFGSPLPSTTVVCQPITFAPLTLPAVSRAHAVAWLHEIRTTSLTVCGLVGVVGPFHVFGQPAAARTLAFAWATRPGAAGAVSFDGPSRDAPAVVERVIATTI